MRGNGPQPGPPFVQECGVVVPPGGVFVRMGGVFVQNRIIVYLSNWLSELKPFFTTPCPVTQESCEKKIQFRKVLF